MQQVDNLRPEELPVSTPSSNNETISLKSNHNSVITIENKTIKINKKRDNMPKVEA